MRYRCDSDTCRTGRHWTRASAEACYRRFLTSRPTVSASVPRPAVDPAEQIGRRMMEAQERRRLKELRQRLIDYVPVPAPDETTRIANHSGERQLRAISDHLRAVDALIATTTYKMNMQLRYGTPQEIDDVLTCIAGYNSYDQLIRQVDEAFGALGAGLQLDQPVQALRGASAATHDVLGLAVGDTFADPGYMFATSSMGAALYYAERHESYGAGSASPLLLRLNLHSALYIPAPEQRTRELVELVDAYPLLKDAVAQYVVPANSTWRIDAIGPAVDDGPAEVEITQVRSVDIGARA